jgi:hypothetical protein
MSREASHSCRTDSYSASRRRSAKPLAGEPFLLTTGNGLALCGRGELFPARVALVRLAHFAAVARLAVRLEADGRQLLSERELAAHERALGERAFSACLEDDSHHRPT